MQEPGIIAAERRRLAGVPVLWRWVQPVGRFARRQPVGFVCGLIILFLIFVAVFAPVIAPYDVSDVSAKARLASPSKDYLLGGDERGHDVFSHVVYGARVSLQVGIFAVLIGVGGGSLAGIITGYFGGKLDMIVQRVMDALLAFPALILALTLAALMGPGLTTAMVAIGIVILPGANRVVRGAAMSVKENTYIEASRIVGCSDLRILWDHILPNVLAPIMIVVSIVMGGAIIVEASLSFLGMGVQPPTPSWGQMLASGRVYMEQAPWLVLAPGAAIIIVVMAFNLLGDALRDHFDPSLKGR